MTFEPAQDLIQYRPPHQEHSTGYGDGGLTQTITPDLASDIDCANGWHEPNEQPAQDTALETSIDALSAIASWLATSETLESAGLRSMALCLVLEKTECRSGAELALRFGVTKAAVSKYVRELVRLAPGFRGPGIRNEAACEQRSEIATAYHSRHAAQTRVEVKSRRGATTILIPLNGGPLPEGTFNRLIDELGPWRGWSSPQARIFRRRGAVQIRLGEHRKKLKWVKHEGKQVGSLVRVSFTFGGRTCLLRIPRDPGYLIFSASRTANALAKYGPPERWHSKGAEFDLYRGLVRAKLKF